MDVEETVKLWLRYSCDQSGGCNQRRSKQQQQLEAQHARQAEMNREVLYVTETGRTYRGVCIAWNWCTKAMLEAYNVLSHLRTCHSCHRALVMFQMPRQTVLVALLHYKVDQKFSTEMLDCVRRVSGVLKDVSGLHAQQTRSLQYVHFTKV